MKPSEKNFCGGNFQDWLEVMLVDKCNGKCSWCIEKKGFKPKNKATAKFLAKVIYETTYKNIILLGGEPTLYRDLKYLISKLKERGKNIYITTNGSMLTPNFIKENLIGVTGINISLHDNNLSENEKITGIELSSKNLKDSIKALHSYKTVVRLNCNLIKGNIGNKDKVEAYIYYAKSLGVDSIRFAELKIDEENFVDLHEIYGNKYGINNEPFGLGCNNDAKINGMPVNFRQMCGLQTTKREKPINPNQCRKTVLYYNGKLYNGWQVKGKNAMEEEKLKKLLNQVKEGGKTVEEAIRIIELESRPGSLGEGEGCQY